MIKIKRLSDQPKLYKKVINLIEESYSYEQINSFEIDFYPLINKSNWKNCYVILDQTSNELLGHIGTKPRFIVFSNENIDCIFLGGIAIKKEFQGKGIFKSAFSHLLDALKSKYSYAFLWSDKIELYKKFNFSPISYSYLKINLNQTSKTLLNLNYQQKSFKELASSEKRQIRKLFKENIEKVYVTPKRTDKIWNEVEEISSIDLFIKYKNNQISSYCLLGKGQDYQNIIHEFVCSEAEDFSINKIENISIIYPQSIHDSNSENHLIPTALYKNFCNGDKLEKFLATNKFFISGADSI